MSMSNYGNSAETVSQDFVKNQCPATYNIFEQMLLIADVTIDEFFLAQYFDGEYETSVMGNTTTLDVAYADLKADFASKTGLTLYVAYHDKEDRADELDGGSWAVGGVYLRSPAGEKFKADIMTVNWTTFG